MGILHVERRGRDSHPLLTIHTPQCGPFSVESGLTLTRGGSARNSVTAPDARSNEDPEKVGRTSAPGPAQPRCESGKRKRLNRVTTERKKGSFGSSSGCGKTMGRRHRGHWLACPICCSR